jgi:hypothetical protein
MLGFYKMKKDLQVTAFGGPYTIGAGSTVEVTRIDDVHGFINIHAARGAIKCCVSGDWLNDMEKINENDNS